MIIETEQEYDTLLKLLDKYFNAKEGTPEYDYLILIGDAIGKYEDIHYPIEGDCNDERPS